MSSGRPAPAWCGTTALAAFNILVGVLGGGAGLFLTALSGLSVHPADSIPPLGMAVAYGLLGVAGALLLGRGRPRQTAAWAAGAAIVAAGGIASALWRHVALRLQVQEGGMLMLAALMVPALLVALAEVAYFRRVAGRTESGAAADGRA